MKKLIILLLISPFSYSQDKTADFSLLGGYEYNSPNSTGWNILFTALGPTEKLPRLEFGFSLSYGVSEFNRDDNDQQLYPSDEFSVNLGGPVRKRHYERSERFRAGIETQYAVINGERSKLYLGTALTLELLSSYREFGYEIYQEVDSTGFTYSSEPYWIEQRGNEIENRSLLLLQPFLVYQFGLSEKISINLRAMSNISLQSIIYPKPGPQLNLGITYSL